MPVVSDPHLPLSKEDYFPISQRGFYREKSTGWRFYFKHIPGLDYPLKCYNDPVGTRELTQEEKEQDPRNSEKYSTFWDRWLHETVKDIWEQEKILLEERSPVFSNQLKEVDKSQWTEAQIASDDKLKVCVAELFAVGLHILKEVKGDG